MSVYLLERHDVIGAGRGALLDMLRDRWGPHLAERFDLELVGLWAAVGSTGRWPESWALTRASSWDAFGEALDGLYPMESRATYAYEMWRHSLRLRSGGESWILTAAEGLPAPGPGFLDQQVSLLEQVRVRPGRLDDYRRAVGELQVPLQARQGIELLGCFSDALAPNRVVNLWSTPDWPELQVPFTSADAEAAEWHRALDELVEESFGFLLAGAPAATLGT